MLRTFSLECMDEDEEQQDEEGDDQEDDNQKGGNREELPFLERSDSDASKYDAPSPEILESPSPERLGFCWNSHVKRAHSASHRHTLCRQHNQLQA